MFSFFLRQERKSATVERAQGRQQHTMLGSTLTAGATRRQPWSTDLHYVRPTLPCEKNGANSNAAESQEAHEADSPHKPRTTGDQAVPELAPSKGDGGSTTTERATASMPTSGTVVIARARPASAPPVRRSVTSRRRLTRGTPPVTRPPEAPPASSRTPGLARLARVFYQSSLASSSTPVVHYTSEVQRGRAPQDNICPHNDSTVVAEEHSSQHQAPSCAPEVQKFPNNVAEECHVGSGYRTRESDRNHGNASQPTRTIGIGKGGTGMCCNRGGTEGSRRRREIFKDRNNNATTHSSAQRTPTKSSLDMVEERLEEVRLLWEASQLSAEAVTRNIMNGYVERRRAREPNRRGRRFFSPALGQPPQPSGPLQEPTTGMSAVEVEGDSTTVVSSRN